MQPSLVAGTHPQLDNLVRRLWVLLDSSLTPSFHTAASISNAFYHLWLIRRFHPILMNNEFALVIHAFFTRWLDYSYVIHLGSKPLFLRKHQVVQNAAAHLLTSASYYTHIKPVLCALCWLLIEYWVKFKTSVLILEPGHEGPWKSTKAPGWRLQSTTLLLWSNGIPSNKGKACLCMRVWNGSHKN